MKCYLHVTPSPALDLSSLLDLRVSWRITSSRSARGQQHSKLRNRRQDVLAATWTFLSPNKLKKSYVRKRVLFALNKNRYSLLLGHKACGKIQGTESNSSAQKLLWIMFSEPAPEMDKKQRQQRKNRSLW